MDKNQLIEGQVAPPVEPLASRSEWVLAAVLAVSLATLVVAPFLVLGNVSGHDVEFHLPSWIDAAQHWREGAPYPSWSGGGHYGFGDPRFVIYPPLSWIIGGLLALMLPGAMLPGAYVWICIALSVFAAYGLAREWLGHGAALWTAGLYVTNPYMLLVVTHRCAYSELLAQVGFPVALLFLLRVGRGDSRGVRDMAPLALAFGWIWLANVPAAVIASYALGFALLAVAIRGRSLHALVRGGTALGLGLGLAAFYILPAALEQHWIQSEDAFATGYDIRANFLFNRSGDADQVAFNRLVSELACAEMMLLAAASIPALRWARKAEGLRGEARSGLPVLLGLAAFFSALLFRWTGPVWLLLPRFWMAQFPWRSLFVISLALAVTMVTAGYAMRRTGLWLGVAVAVWLALGGAILTRAPWLPDDIHKLIEAAPSQKGYVGVVDEFLPVGVDPESLDADAPRIAAFHESGEEVGDGVRTTVSIWHAEEKRFTVETDRPAQLRLHLLNFHAWHATLNGSPIMPQTDPGTGQMVISAPKGHSEVRIWFGPTPGRAAGVTLSFCAVGALLMFARMTPNRANSC
jgi:hypothetical protein